MLLHGHNVRLRPLVPEDRPSIALWSHQVDAHSELARRATAMLFSPAAGRFGSATMNSVLLLITDRENKRLGFAHAYSISARNRWLYVDVFTIRDASPIARMEAWLLLLDFVFAWYPIETVYHEEPKFVERHPSLIGSLGFEEQGVLKARIWLGDRLHDSRILALTRARWQQFRPILVTNIELQGTYDSLADEVADRQED